MGLEGERLGRALAREHATQALIALLREDNLPFTVFGGLMGAHANNGRFMAVHLERFGLVEITSGPGPFPGQLKYGVTLTALGREIATDLRAVAAKMPDSDIRRAPQV